MMVGATSWGSGQCAPTRFYKNTYPNISKASCLVLSSQYEGWGSVVLEAMALGVPTLVVNCPGSGSEVEMESMACSYHAMTWRLWLMP